MSNTASFLRTASLAAAVGFTATSAFAADLRVAVGCPPVEACGDWHFAEDFKSRLAEHGIEAELALGGALGPDPDVVDQMSQGLVEVGLTNFVMVRQFEPMVLGFMTPYMFDDQEHMFRAIDEGSVIERINETLAPEGLQLATLTGVGGGIGIFNAQRPVTSVDDLSGLRMRAIDSSQVALFEAWGTQGVVVDMAEFATSVQSGVVDGYLNPPVVAMIFQHTDFLTHYSDVGAGFGVRSVLMSRDWYAGLDDDARAAVDDALQYATAQNRAWTLGAAEAEITQLEERDVTVTTLSEPELDEFRRRARSVWDDLMPAEHVDDFEALADRTRQ